MIYPLSLPCLPSSLAPSLSQSSHIHLPLSDITHDSEQILYRSCLAIDKSSLTQCREPVIDILSEESHCPQHAAPVGGDLLPGRPPPRKKMALQQPGSRLPGPVARRVGGVMGASSNGGALKLVRKSGLAGRGMAATSGKVCITVCVISHSQLF